MIFNFIPEDNRRLKGNQGYTLQLTRMIIINIKKVSLRIYWIGITVQFSFWMEVQVLEKSRIMNSS